MFAPPDAGREHFLAFPQSFFFPFRDALQRCWSSFFGLRFAHYQQEYIKAFGPNCFFLKGWGLSQHLRDRYFGDYHSVSDGICRKRNPCCGVRCRSRAYPSHPTGSTFQHFPGQIQFSGLHYRESTPLFSVLALTHSAGPKGTRRLVPPSVCLGQWGEHTWTPGLFQPGKWKGKWDGSLELSKVTEQSRAVCPDAVRPGMGRWFSPKDTEQLAVFLLPSSSSEAPLESGCWL